MNLKTVRVRVLYCTVQCTVRVPLLCVVQYSTGSVVCRLYEYEYCTTAVRVRVLVPSCCHATVPYGTCPLYSYEYCRLVTPLVATRTRYGTVPSPLVRVPYWIVLHFVMHLSATSTVLVLMHKCTSHSYTSECCIRSLLLYKRYRRTIQKVL